MADSLETYRKIIIDILNEYTNIPSVSSPKDEVEEQLLIDTIHDHYQILTIGWENGKRVYYPVFHLDIKNNKIWVQEDATDFDLVGELERRGVAQSDIVLGFHAPFKRQYTNYAAV